MHSFFKPGQVVLFQGDSVTDCSRADKNFAPLGNGYAQKISVIYQTLFAKQNVQFVNRGVSGNRACDLLARYEKDFKAVQPDFISILIGINDTWRRYDSNDETPQSVFLQQYETLLQKIKTDLPRAEIMLIEPFVLPSCADHLHWREDLGPKIEVVRALAREYADYFLPMDGILAQAQTACYTAQQLSLDGVHPTDCGHGVIAHAWLRALEIL